MSDSTAINSRESFTVSNVKKICERLVPLLTSLKRFESSFGKIGVAGSSDAAKQLLAESIKISEDAQIERPVAGGTIARFLLLGSELSSARHAHDILTTNLASILNDGMIPVTRSAKEELSSLRSELASINFAPDDPSPESDMFVSFRALYTKAKEAKDNINLVETELDESVRLLISKAFGEERTPSLEPSILEAEVQSLTDVASSIIHSKGNQETADKWMVEDAAVLSLVANSLQRLHAAPDDDEDEGAEIEEDEEETAEDDEDDMFYMPMMPVMADAANFSALAAPLSPTEAKPFMISMEPEVEGGDAVRYSNPRASRDVGDMPGGGEAVAEEEALPGLTEADFVPIARGVDGGEEPPLMSEEKARQENEVQGATEALAAAALIGAAAAVGAEAVSSVAKTESAPTDVVPSDAPEDKAAKANVADDVDKDFKVAANAAAPADPAAAAAAAAFATALTDPSAQAATTPTGKPDDKLNNFVNFLQGDNPGACMFHAQMRLSLEGCKKLADFVAGSSRVRALSLSHNFIGDDGLFVLCQGLKLNASVTSLELPSNNIGNKGVSDLCEAVKKNPALTQLQLSNNKIGDEGAVSLAEFIKKTSALKKLGLSNNSVGKTGCHALIEALKVNSSIIQLQILPGNPVEEKDAKKLQKALLKKEKKFSIGGFLSQFNY